MMKEIRILTGLHTGARIQLATGIWKIGSDENADVQISDWQHATIQLEIEESGRTAWIAADTDGPGASLADMQPLRFDGIVLCSGDPVATWPDDAALLEKLMPAAAAEASGMAMPVPASMPAAGKRQKRWLVFGSAAMTMACISSALLLGNPSQADILPSNEIVLLQIQDMLVKLHQRELEAMARGDLIVVQGMVSSSADAVAVKQMLQKVAPSKSLADFAIVNDVIANIQDSLHDPALKVSYSGKGNFIVTGGARSVAAVQKTVAQIGADFGSSVKRIEAVVTPAPHNWAVADSDSALVADSLQYMQSLDGSKHFPTVRD
jgi:type III secretion protein D